MVSGGLFRFNPCPKVDIHVDLDANVVIDVDVYMSLFFVTFKHPMNTAYLYM